MRLRPFFPYFGAKTRIAPRYPAPAHGHVVEPFAGSAGYALLYADRDVTLVDRDPTICALWRFLIAARPSEILSIPLLGPGESTDDLAVCQEARDLVGFWLNKGVTRPRRTFPRSSWGQQFPHQFWGERMRARVAAQVESIRHWKVVEGSYADVPNERATYFVDPPYIGRVRASKWRAGGVVELRAVGDRYRFGSRSIDYEHLATWCRTRRGQVIACENVGATWLPFRPFIVAKSNHHRRVSEEAIWTNERLNEQTWLNIGD